MSPLPGLHIAAQAESQPGTRLKALRLAAGQLLTIDPQRTRAALEAAWREAPALPLLGGRLRARSLVIQIWPRWIPGVGGSCWPSFHPNAQPWRAEAASALILVQAQPDDHLLATLAWASLDPNRALFLGTDLKDPVIKAKTLVSRAKSLAGRHATAAAHWALRLAEISLANLGPKEAIDKVRLMGHMGREWATVETARARRYFQQGVEAATQLGQPSKGSGL